MAIDLNFKGNHRQLIRF